MGNGEESVKFVFVTQDDPFYIKIFFETFFKNYKDLSEVQGVLICKTMGKSQTKMIKQMFYFYGPADFMRVGFRYAWSKVIGKLLRKVYFGKFFDLEHVCSYFNMEIINCNNINDSEMVNLIRNKGVDLIISVAAPHIFKENILRVAKRGCINIHNARLPKYRGMLPNFWNMYRGEKTSAITIHTMDLEIDRGKILLQRDFEIQPEESLDQLIKRTKALGALYLIEVLDQIKRGTVEFRYPDEVEGSYFSFPTPSDVKQFRLMGKRLL